ITGKGVSIAIIDQGLNPHHIEYKDKLMGYELVHCFGTGAAMHGSAVTSIAVGNTCGVAPDAEVYYIASTFGRITPLGFRSDVSSMADGIDRVIEINELLPEEKKIRVISVSKGFGNTVDGRKVQKAIERAKEADIFVLTTSPYVNYDFSLMGLGKNFEDDPDVVESYKPGMFWRDDFYKDGSWLNPEETLLVPMDARTYASWDGVDGYEFCAEGGLSWAVPWMAGLYALCAQEYPDITPDTFIQKTFETGMRQTIVQDGKEYTLGTIVNPGALVEALGDAY
ncbi:MAG: S8/S53 family peptidase, partial [Lachnospiraceae bacterium]|nr:S8/S53 family peptidase [Lachnospiraceae bacterium]